MFRKKYVIISTKGVGEVNLWQYFEVKRSKCLENKGISFHYEKGIDGDLRKIYISFAKWLRKTYLFPIHINVYIKNCERVRLQSGTMAYGSFRWFEKRPPYIRIPSKIEPHLLNEFSKDELYEQILSSLVHELTHYFQWVLDLEQDDAVSERQANYYRYRIIEKYYQEDIA